MKILDVYIEHAKNSLDRPFSYLYDGKEKVDVGYRVLVKFGQQRLMGFVSKVRDTSLTKEQLEQANGFAFSFVTAIVDKEPLLNEELLRLADEVASYYMAPKISVLQAMLPPSLKPSKSALNGPKIAYDSYVRVKDDSEDGLSVQGKEALRLVKRNGECLKKEAGTPSVVATLIKKGRLEVFQRERNRLVLQEYEKEQPHELNLEQEKAYETILSSEKEVILLQGVTGSGKTEVYLHLADAYLKQGKTILMLVPEISLTPIMVEYFSRRFEGKVAILHSELTPAEKYDEYRRIARGEAKVVVGARSAIFAPLQNIGLIILDEEQVESYKQDTLPYYHAREVAILRAKHFGAKVLLGSATPTLETKARAMKGVYGYATLLHRANELPLPETKIVDLSHRELARVGDHDRIFSKTLLSAIADRLQKKEQVVLLINRRGYSSYVTCSHCGYIFVCPNCHGNLTYHKEDDMLKCHHCGYVCDYPTSCPRCGSDLIQRIGFGTERICKALLEAFPEARVARLDTDVTKVRSNLSKVLESFRKGEYDVLVGTQMVAKGHDFPNVTLVGVVLADIGLSLPTYRAAERTFQLIAQAVGRSGRGQKKGTAIIQTYNPTHYAITLGAAQDYEGFYRKEMQERRQSQYPPYVYLILLQFSSKNEDRCVHAACDVKKDIERQGFEGVVCLGPITPYYAFVGERHRRFCVVKYKKSEEIKPYLEELLRTISGKGGVDIVYDVDPLDY